MLKKEKKKTEPLSLVILLEWLDFVTCLNVFKDEFT